MICGIGIDIVHIPKFKKAVERWGDRFRERVFTKGELEYCSKKGFPVQHLAARFAAKEALFKALGKGINFTDVEVVNNQDGRPRLNFKHAPECLYRGSQISKMPPNVSIGGLKSHLTISHDRDYCIAQVILEV